ncbi:MAG: hypothetical protein QXU40_03045 [Candidatus Pacearchaeota archaeon]
MTILWFVGYYFVALLGMVSHILKKNVEGETVKDIGIYVKTHFKTILMGFIATLISYFTLIGSEPEMFTHLNIVSFTACFGAGYTFDSAFKAWDAHGKHSS